MSERILFVRYPRNKPLDKRRHHRRNRRSAHFTTDKKVTKGNCTVRHITLDSFRRMSQLVLAVDCKVTRGLATAFRASLPSRVSVTRKQTLPSKRGPSLCNNTSSKQLSTTSKNYWSLKPTRQP